MKAKNLMTKCLSCATINSKHYISVNTPPQHILSVRITLKRADHFAFFDRDMEIFNALCYQLIAGKLKCQMWKHCEKSGGGDFAGFYISDYCTHHIRGKHKYTVFLFDFRFSCSHKKRRLIWVQRTRRQRSICRTIRGLVKSVIMYCLTERRLSNRRI